MTLDLPAVRRVVSLQSPSPPPMATASNSRSTSRSSSYGGLQSKRLVFQGQSVNVILPENTPDVPQAIDDIQDRVKKIHDVEEDEVRSVFGDFVTVGRFVDE